MKSGALREMGRIEDLARQDTPLHRLDARAKLLVTLGYLIVVLSFDRYAVSALIPFSMYPVALCAAGRIPFRFVLRKTLWALPFAALVGAFNPILDQEVRLVVGPVLISGGWISWFSILVRGFLSVSASVALVAVTGFVPVCEALGRLGMPRVFVVQLLMLHRYGFLLVRQGMQRTQAMALRRPISGHPGLPVWRSMIGQLLLHSLERAQRVHSAMMCRGFDGQVRTSHRGQLRLVDMLFIAGGLGVMVALRLWNLSWILGQAVSGGVG